MRRGAPLAPTFTASHFAAMFAHAPAAMLVVDLDASVVLVNVRAEEMLGFSRNELLGRSADRLAPPDRRREWRHALLSPTGPLPPRAVHHTIVRRKDGQRVTLDLEPRLIDVGNAPLILASLVDNRERLGAAATIAAAAQEKNLLVSEVHHRVKNNLQVICSLLRLQMAEIDDPELSDVLSDSYARIVSMALVHQAICHAPNVARVDFHYFLDMLVVRLREIHRHSDTSLPFELDAIELSMTMDRAMPCGLVANELLADALRRSMSSRCGLKVSLSARDRTTGCLRLQHAAPSGSWAPVGRGDLGSRLIELLVEQAHGTLHVDDRPGGAREFTFPIHAHPHVHPHVHPEA